MATNYHVEYSNRPRMKKHVAIPTLPPASRMLIVLFSVYCVFILYNSSNKINQSTRLYVNIPIMCKDGSETFELVKMISHESREMIRM